jgi:hypothetical protein
VSALYLRIMENFLDVDASVDLVLIVPRSGGQMSKIRGDFFTGRHGARSRAMYKCREI